MGINVSQSTLSSLVRTVGMLVIGASICAAANADPNYWRWEIPDYVDGIQYYDVATTSVAVDPTTGFPHAVGIGQWISYDPPEYRVDLLYFRFDPMLPGYVGEVVESGVGNHFIAAFFDDVAIAAPTLAISSTGEALIVFGDALLFDPPDEIQIRFHAYLETGSGWSTGTYLLDDLGEQIDDHPDGKAARLWVDAAFAPDDPQSGTESPVVGMGYIADVVPNGVYQTRVGVGFAIAGDPWPVWVWEDTLVHPAQFAPCSYCVERLWGMKIEVDRGSQFSTVEDRVVVAYNTSTAGSGALYYSDSDNRPGRGAVLEPLSTVGLGPKIGLAMMHDTATPPASSTPFVAFTDNSEGIPKVGAVGPGPGYSYSPVEVGAGGLHNLVGGVAGKVPRVLASEDDNWPNAFSFNGQDWVYDAIQPFEPGLYNSIKSGSGRRNAAMGLDGRIFVTGGLGTPPTPAPFKSGIGWEHAAVPADFLTIQDAIDSVPGDASSAPSLVGVIVVEEGTYYENLDFGSKDLVLTSRAPQNAVVRDNTIIDGSMSGPVITLSSAQSASTEIRGLTIQNGDNPGEAGGGIAGNDASATVRNNRIKDNEAQIGGGIAFNHGPIIGNIIEDNFAGLGGGIAHCDGGEEGPIQANSILGNLAGQGGGIVNSETNILDNTINGNAALAGGGILQNETFASRIARNRFNGNGAWGGGAIYLQDAVITELLNNQFHGNTTSGVGPAILAASPVFLHISHNSIALGNQGGGSGGNGIRVTGSGSVYIQNTIVWTEGTSTGKGSEIYISSGITANIVRCLVPGIDNEDFVEAPLGAVESPIDATDYSWQDVFVDQFGDMLVAGSPAIDAADVQDCGGFSLRSCVEDDLFGNTRSSPYSVGCHEYGAE